MNVELLKILRCPKTGEKFELQVEDKENDKIIKGYLISSQHKYPIINFIPRFVSDSNYADNFGIQWNLFSKTQLDSNSGHPISKNRFNKATAWEHEKLVGNWVLDVGCGAGRFTEIALNAGMKVISLDYSNAVDACYDNLKHHPNFHIVQGDIYSLPLVRGFFPFVFSLGVLQHTPHVEKAFKSLTPMLSSGGHLCVDFYMQSWKNVIHPKYWLRPFTKRMSSDVLFKLLHYLVPKLLPLSILFGRVPKIGQIIKQIIPVVNYKGVYPLRDQQLIEWALLDTFDWLSPEFDFPQKLETIYSWFEESGFQNIEVLKAGHLVGRGIKGTQ